MYPHEQGLRGQMPLTTHPSWEEHTKNNKWDRAEAQQLLTADERRAKREEKKDERKRGRKEDRSPRQRDNEDSQSRTPKK